MKIGIDSYCYHRLFGEVYDMQEKPEKLKTVDEFLDLAKRLDVDGVSLETCFLPSLEDGYLKELGAKLKEMQFDTNKFYQYVFADIEAEMEIEILDTTNDQDKAAKRVYNIISEITSEVMKKMNEKCFTELT